METGNKSGSQSQLAAPLLSRHGALGTLAQGPDNVSYPLQYSAYSLICSQILSIMGSRDLQ